MSNSMTVSKCPVSLFLPLDLVFIYKTLPQNFKVRRLTFPNISKRSKTGVFQRTLTLFHRHYSLERNKKKSVATFFRQFSDEENKKKSKQIGQEKVALTITGAEVVARKLTFSNNISELYMLDGAPPAPRWLFHYITVKSHAAGMHMGLSCTCGDREWIAQVTQSNKDKGTWRAHYWQQWLRHVCWLKDPKCSYNI